MKRYLNLTIIVLLLSLFMFSCKEPDDDHLDDDSDTLKYTIITPEYSLRHLAYADYYSFAHFLTDDIVCVMATGERFNIEMAEFGTDGTYWNSSSIYESEIKLDITAAISFEYGGFLAVGGIFNETPYPYSNPFYKSADPVSEIRIFDWNGRNNNFEGVTMYDNQNKVGALFLARDEMGTIGGKYPLFQYSIAFSEYYDDSLYISPFPIDSCYIDYYDKPSVFTERFVGVKVDGLTTDTGLVTHMFYFENAGGNLTEYNLGDLSQGKTEPENIYYENVNPLKIYRWSYKAKNILTLEKYSHNGNKEYSRDITLFEYAPLTEAVCMVEKSADHNYCLVYGYFLDKSSIPDPPVYKGNFLIRIDDEGNETDRVIWNEDFTGKCAGELHIQDIGNNSYIFLYSFDFETDNDYFVVERIDL